MTSALRPYALARRGERAKKWPVAPSKVHPVEDTQGERTEMYRCTRTCTSHPPLSLRHLSAPLSASYFEFYSVSRSADSISSPLFLSDVYMCVCVSLCVAAFAFLSLLFALSPSYLLSLGFSRLSCAGRDHASTSPLLLPLSLYV